LSKLGLDVLCLTKPWLFESDVSTIRAGLPKKHSFYHVPRTKEAGVPRGGVALTYSLALSNIKQVLIGTDVQSSFEAMEVIIRVHYSDP